MRQLVLQSYNMWKTKVGQSPGHILAVFVFRGAQCKYGLGVFTNWQSHSTPGFRSDKAELDQILQGVPSEGRRLAQEPGNWRRPSISVLGTLQPTRHF